MLPEDFEQLISVTQLLQYKKEQIVIDSNNSTRVGLLVVEGVFRTYYIDENGSEITLSLHRPMDFSGTWESILLGATNTRIVEAVSDGRALIFDYNQLSVILESNPRLQKTYIRIIHMMYADALAVYQSLLNAKPQARYNYIMDWLGPHASLVPQKLLASFLGITPVSLSRMKRRVRQ